MTIPFPPAGWKTLDFSISLEQPSSIPLAAIIIIGPRMGRFDSRWPESFGGENLTFAAAGTFLLIMGWLGFNGGSVLATSELLPLVFLNTLVAGVSGGIATTLVAWKNNYRPNIIHIMMGILAGLVAITGSCNRDRSQKTSSHRR